MATFLKITQGNATNRKDPKTVEWTYVNTTLADELIIMQKGLLPLAVENIEGNLSDNDAKRLNSLINKFLEQGKFLTHTNYVTLNVLLDLYDYAKIDLVDDGNYWQPVMPGKKTPCKEAWKANGKSRTKEFEQVITDYNTGKLLVTKITKKDTTLPATDVFQNLFKA